MLHIVTGITALLAMHNQAPRSWELRSWSPSTWVVYLKVYLLLKVSCAIIYIHPFPLLATFAFHTNWPFKPQCKNLQILLTGFYTVLVVLVQRTSFYWHLHYSCLVINSLILITWLKHCYCREMLVTGASRVNVHVSFCDNYLIELEGMNPEGGTQQSFIRGGSIPRSNPYPFIYHFWPKRYPFCIPFIEKFFFFCNLLNFFCNKTIQYLGYITYSHLTYKKRYSTYNTRYNTYNILLTIAWLLYTLRKN